MPDGAVVTRLGATVRFPDGGSGWLETPAVQGRQGAIILIPEWWGLDDWIKDDAERFAHQGYVALAVDIYRGRSTSDPAEAHELMRGLPEDRAMADMKAAFELLAKRPDVDPERIAVIGWCMGGGYALALAVEEPRLRGVVVNYGKLVTAPEKIDAIHAAVLGNFAGLDRGIAPDDVRSFAARLKMDRQEVDVKLYEGAKHAFMNPNNKEAFNAAAASDAWSRIDAFFAHTIGAH